MPHARIPTDLLVELVADVPPRRRAQVAGVYVQAILTSAEMLLDGALRRTIWREMCAEIGVFRSTEVADLLIEAGALHRGPGGRYEIVNWERFHSSRAEVEERRKADAKRKRDARSQPELPGVRTNVRTGHQTVQESMSARMSAPDNSRTRAGARPGGQSQEPEDQEPQAVDERTTTRAYGDMNGLPFSLELLAYEAAAGDEASAATIRTAAAGLPEAAIARAREALRTRRPRPANPAGYAVSVLRGERERLETGDQS